MGVGTNPFARLSPESALEAEKVLGTVHVALGNDATIGGNVSVAYHSDGVLLRPTMFLAGEEIIREGKFLL